MVNFNMQIKKKKKKDVLLEKFLSLEIASPTFSPSTHMVAGCRPPSLSRWDFNILPPTALPPPVLNSIISPAGPTGYDICKSPSEAGSRK